MQHLYVLSIFHAFYHKFTQILFQPIPSPLRLLLLAPNAISPNEILPVILSPPRAPLTGLSSFLPPFGTRPPRANILSQYRDAIVSLSERLGTDKCFLV